MLGQANFNSRYIKQDKIGQGSFGSVFMCTHRRLNLLAAAKKISITKDILSLKRLLREVLLLKYLKYEHLICLRDCFLGYDKQGAHIIFVTDFMEINLRDLIFKKKVEYTPNQVKYYLYQIFLALAYLHLNNIVHRDIKSDNILVNQNNEIRVVDFGWARHIKSSSELTKIIANIHYRAPEICLRNTLHDSKVDIWGVGCIFYELLMKRFLFDADKDLMLLESMFQKFGSLSPEETGFIERSDAREWVLNRAPLPKRRPSDYLTGFDDPLGRDLFDRCLQIDPHKRINASEALQHPYFADIFDPDEMRKGMENHSHMIDFSFEADPNLTQEQLLFRIAQEIKDIPPWE